MTSFSFTSVLVQKLACLFLNKDTFHGKACQGELASVYSRQVSLDKWTCQGKLASVNAFNEA